MQPVRLGSRDLLEYDARYGVLICRKCQYAIQKSALESHLLRHKIYRGERQRLLSSIAQLDLFEPHHVPLPAPASTPIDALPIISGYRCTVAECGNLCASSKRMRRHWSEVHGLSGSPPNASSFARPVKLQTFFRGTKIRYFEVTSSSATDTAEPVPLATTTDDNDNDNDDDDDENGEEAEEKETEERRHDEQGNDGDKTTPLSSPPPPPRVRTSFKTHSNFSQINLDLETLTYFHHFTTSTYLTLPGAEHHHLASQYWQTDVVLEALRRQWLMGGLLAISAYHLAVLADDITIKRVHHERLAQFLSAFSAGLDETTKCDLGAASNAVQEDANMAEMAGEQVRCILRFAHWALTDSMLDERIISEPTIPFELLSIMKTFRSFIVPDFALYPRGLFNDLEKSNKKMFAQARKIVEMESSPTAGSFGAVSSSEKTPSVLLNQLRALPYRMSETFGKPESSWDVFATLSAIAVLVECCDISFTSNDLEVAWKGMAAWLSKVPDHFNHMVSLHSPPALVVVAHWAALLVRRAEHCGCWFLKGLAKTILLQIAERFSNEDRAVQRLVDRLIM